MTGRSVPEWIGKTPDSAIPNAVKLRIWFREGGRCHVTGAIIRPDRTAKRASKAYQPASMRTGVPWRSSRNCGSSSVASSAVTPPSSTTTSS